MWIIGVVHSIIIIIIVIIIIIIITIFIIVVQVFPHIASVSIALIVTSCGA